MVEERARAQGGEKIDGPDPPLSPSSLLPPAKRILPAPSSCSPLPFKKKSRNLPSLANCHSCNLRIHSKESGREKLQTLDSQWRIVLLCKKCLASIRSAEICSYCFSKISEEEDIFLNCLQCFSRVHYSCIPQQRCYISPLQLDPESFACIDCCPILKSRNRNPRSFSRMDSRVSLEDVVRDAFSAAEKKVVEAARAKENALRKVIAAKHAAELARNALGAVLEVKEPPDLVNPGDEFALQLHMVMNGLQRILKSPCRKSLDCSVDLKKVKGSSDLISEVQVFTEDKSFFGQNSSLDLDYTEKKEEKKESSAHSKDGSVDMPLKEKQESCSKKVANSGGGVNSIGLASMPCQRPNESNGMMPLTTCGGGGEEDSCELQQKRSGMADRFLKTYSRRQSCLKTYSRRHSCLKTYSRRHSRWIGRKSQLPCQ